MLPKLRRRYVNPQHWQHWQHCPHSLAETTQSRLKGGAERAVVVLLRLKFQFWFDYIRGSDRTHLLTYAESKAIPVTARESP
jgi:hypothetical protein